MSRASTDPLPTGARTAADAARGAIVVGLMSGTSLDGVSSAVVRFAEQSDGRIAHEVLGVGHTAYPEAARERLQRAMHAATPQEYCRLHADLGGWLADAAAALLADAGVARGDVWAVASHGQTIWHEPGHSTWQIGDPSVIAERLGVPVVSDFRARDVAAGGQGAPLVSLADALLYSHDTQWRAMQNLGGIGNVTIVPPRGVFAGVRALDTGPGVVLIDALARRADPSVPFDVDGRIARQGRVAPGVIASRLREPYFRAEPPKSTGRELFSLEYARAVATDVEAELADATPADAVRTAVELTAASIADAYDRFLPEPIGDVVISGGGARHPVLRERLAALLAPRRVVRFDEIFYDGEAKEAVAFALMGWRHLCGAPANVPSATGARGPRILGSRTPV
jgi:anhydro-N-acetylmuramic acid kinase